MIITKTPFRISFVGGGTDFEDFYTKSYGAVLSTTIDRFMYVNLNKKFSEGYRVAYSKVEDVGNVREINHPIVREAIIESGIKESLEISSMADIPSKGSGLGSSSSYCVGLLNALYKFKGINLEAKELAKKASFIEIKKCGDPIGIQDQYAAAYGGMNLFTFTKNNVEVLKINNSQFVREIESSLLFFYTGKTRSASKILKGHQDNINNGSSLSVLDDIKEIPFKLYESIKKENIDDFSYWINLNWKLKKTASSASSNEKIDSIIETGLRNGALGAKLLGAGMEGFVMFVAPKNKHKKIIDSLSSLSKQSFKFYFSGSEVVRL